MSSVEVSPSLWTCGHLGVVIKFMTVGLCGHPAVSSVSVDNWTSGLFLCSCLCCLFCLCEDKCYDVYSLAVDLWGCVVFIASTNTWEFIIVSAWTFMKCVVCCISQV